MDRPEDVQPSSTREKVWVVLTNNDKRRPEQVDRANPRPENEFGHIIEMTPPDGDHAAHVFRWDVLIRCGDPASRRSRRSGLRRASTAGLPHPTIARSMRRAACG